MGCIFIGCDNKQISEEGFCKYHSSILQVPGKTSFLKEKVPVIIVTRDIFSVLGAVYKALNVSDGKDFISSIPFQEESYSAIIEHCMNFADLYISVVNINGVPKYIKVDNSEYMSLLKEES